jgi:hypothetical protein
MLEKRILKKGELNGDEKSEKKRRRHKKRRKNDENDVKSALKEDRKPSAKPKCGICGKIGHRDENCWNLDKNAKKQPANFQPANTNSTTKLKTEKALVTGTEPLFTEEQMSVMMKKVMASIKDKYGGSKKIKRQVHYKESASASDSNSDKSSSEKCKKFHPYYLAYTYLFDYARNMEAPTHK